MQNLLDLVIVQLIIEALRHCIGIYFSELFVMKISSYLLLLFKSQSCRALVVTARGIQTFVVHS